MSGGHTDRSAELALVAPPLAAAVAARFRSGYCPGDILAERAQKGALRGNTEIRVFSVTYTPAQVHGDPAWLVEQTGLITRSSPNWASGRIAAPRPRPVLDA